MIASSPSLLNRLETAVPVLVANLVRVSGNVDALLDADNRRAVKATLADLAQVSHMLAARSATIDATLAGAWRATTSAADAAVQLQQLLQRVERTADAFDRMASEVSGAGTTTRAALESARNTLDATRPEVQQFTGATLPELRELVAELRGLTATLRRVGSEIERDPGTLLRGRQPARRGPGE